MSTSDLEKRMKKIRDSLNVTISEKKKNMHRFDDFKNRSLRNNRSSSSWEYSNSPARSRSDSSDTYLILKSKNFIDELDEIERKIEREYKLYEKDPTSHRRYRDEWQHYWGVRFVQLQNEGRNPHKHDFSDEWKTFFIKRLKMFKSNQLQVAKDNLIKKYKDSCLKETKYRPSMSRSPARLSRSRSRRMNSNRKFSPSNSQKRLDAVQQRTCSSKVTVVSLCSQMLTISEISNMYGNQISDLIDAAVDFQKRNRKEFCMNPMQFDFISRTKKRLQSLLLDKYFQPKNVTSVKQIVQKIQILMNRWLVFTGKVSKLKIKRERNESFSSSGSSIIDRKPVPAKIRCRYRDSSFDSTSPRRNLQSPSKAVRVEVKHESRKEMKTRTESHDSSLNRFKDINIKLKEACSNSKQVSNKHTETKMILKEELRPEVDEETNKSMLEDLIPTVQYPPRSEYVDKKMSMEELLIKKVEILKEIQVNYDSSESDTPKQLSIDENNSESNELIDTAAQSSSSTATNFTNEEIIELLKVFEVLPEKDKCAVMKLIKEIEQTDQRRFEYLALFICPEKDIKMAIEDQ